jgi:hypothetical protein
MNTVLSDEQITKALEPIPEDVFRDWDSFSPYPIYREIAKSQDAHTRLELAKAVREIENPYDKELKEPCTKSYYKDLVVCKCTYDEALQAVLKVLEGE